LLIVQAQFKGNIAATVAGSIAQVGISSGEMDDGCGDLTPDPGCIVRQAGIDGNGVTSPWSIIR
jgi:hypothetical protein